MIPHTIPRTVRTACSVALALVGSVATDRPATATSEVQPAWEIPAEDVALLDFAVSELTSRCMEREGFEYHVTPYASLVTSYEHGREARALEFPYDAGAEGIPYRFEPGVGAATERQLAADANRQYEQSLSDAALQRYGIALMGSGEVEELDVLGMEVGVSSDGCLAESRVEIFEDLEAEATFGYVFANAIRGFHTAARADPDVSDATDEWRRCMADRGYQLDGFADARALSFKVPDQAVSIAAADAECTASTSLAALYQQAYDAAESSFLESNGAALSELRSDLEDALERAVEVLESSR